MIIPELQRFSASVTELVLPLVQALEALEFFERAGVAVLGWEGWLRYSDGSLGHSSMHQGTALRHPAATPQEYARLRESMETAQTEHLASPEVPGTQLLFCVTPDA
jgi:hypothetical protein